MALLRQDPCTGLGVLVGGLPWPVFFPFGNSVAQQDGSERRDLAGIGLPGKLANSWQNGFGSETQGGRKVRKPAYLLVIFGGPGWT